MTGFVLLIAAGVVLGTAALLSGGSERRRLKRLRDAEPVAIADLVEGRPAIFGGRVAVSEPVVAPVSRRPCAYYRVTLSRFKFSERRDLLITGGDDFYVEDHSGRALVVAGDAALALNADRILFSDSETFERLRTLAREHDFELGALKSQVLVDEEILLVGADVRVEGIAVVEPDIDAAAINSARRLYRESALLPIVSRALVADAPRPASYVDLDAATD